MGEQRLCSDGRAIANDRPEPRPFTEVDMQCGLIREVVPGPCHNFGHAARAAGLSLACSTWNAESRKQVHEGLMTIRVILDCGEETRRDWNSLSHAAGSGVGSAGIGRAGLSVAVRLAS